MEKKKNQQERQSEMPCSELVSIDLSKIHAYVVQGKKQILKRTRKTRAAS